MDRACHQASSEESSRGLLPSHAQQTNEDERKDCNIDSLGEERSDGNHFKRVVEKQAERRQPHGTTAKGGC